MAQHWAPGVAGRVAIEVVGQGGHQAESSDDR
jgi:hypothetical protein